MLLSICSPWLHMNSLLRFGPGLFWARAPLQQTLHASKLSMHSESVQKYPTLRRQKWREDEIQIVDAAISKGKSWKDCIDLLLRRTPGAIDVFWGYRRNAAKLKQTSKDSDVQAFLDLAAKGLVETSFIQDSLMLHATVSINV